jgi:hypothetical protein
MVKRWERERGALDMADFAWELCFSVIYESYDAEIRKSVGDIASGPLIGL